MLSWMLYSIVVSLLMGLAALALERSAQIRQRPVRWLWGTCMVASLAIPLIPSEVSVQIPETTHADRAASSEIPTPPRTTAIELSRVTLPIIGTAQTLLSNEVSTLLDWTWRMASMALALVILASGVHLSWRRRRWDRGHIAGTAVYISEDSGPAVVGFLRPHIVVPRWLTKLSLDEQELVIAHERSHLGAYDTQSLTIAVCLLACMPWNPVLWWQLRRLRLAIEIDCDARVLSLGYPVARYSETLIAVGVLKVISRSAFDLQTVLQTLVKSLLNLISNGFYAATRREVRDGTFEPVLSATTRNLGKTVEIRIRDNGAGIPPEVRDKMFNPFFTTKPTGEGTGLGLSMTHDIIVKQHGGRIEVETEPGEFTEFIITLPRETRGVTG